MKTLHLALAVSNLELSIAEYSARLEALPVVVVPGEYALWRTEKVNLSIRKTKEPSGTLRHLGWEDTEATSFTTEKDCNGIVWENFASAHQNKEINEIWPNAIDPIRE